MAECLQCGDSREAVERESLSCGIVSTGEYTELIEEWPRHRWADWRDVELERFGVKRDAFDRHRRTKLLDFMWIACDDTERGHRPAETPEDVEWFGGPVGRCMLCGRAPESDNSEETR